MSPEELPFEIKRFEPSNEISDSAEQAEQERQHRANLQAQNPVSNDPLQLITDLPQVEKDFKGFWRAITTKGLVHTTASFARSVPGPASATQANITAWWLCAAVREGHGPIQSELAAWNIARKVFEREFVSNPNQNQSQGQASDQPHSALPLPPDEPPHLHQLTPFEKSGHLVCPNCKQGRLLEETYTVAPDTRPGVTCNQCHIHYSDEKLEEWSA